MKLINALFASLAVIFLLDALIPDPYWLLVYFWMWIGCMKIKAEKTFIGTLKIWAISPFWPLYIRR